MTLYKAVNTEAFLLKRLVKKAQPILFVGESTTRSLPITLAIMRGSFSDIWATSFVPAQEVSRPGLCKDYFTRAKDIAEQRKEVMKEFLPSTSGQHQFKIGVGKKKSAKLHAQAPHQLDLRADATRMDKFFTANPLAPRKNIWFQCPFVGCGPSTAKLVLDSLRSISSHQSHGDALIFGILTHPTFSPYYELKHVLEEARKLGYSIASDGNFIQKCIQLGYVHETAVSKSDRLHSTVLTHHITYALLKHWYGILPSSPGVSLLETLTIPYSDVKDVKPR